MPFPNVEAAAPFSPIDDEPPLRWQRAVHLAPRDSLGVGRRAVVFALAGWVPIALWASIRGRFIHATGSELLLQHYGVHVRCLVAIPLLILGEATLQRASQRYFPQFISMGLVDEATRPAFETVLRNARAWSDRALPWLLMLAAALVWTFASRASSHGDELSWALEANGRLGFGGVWFVYVVRPLFVALLLAWLWRIALLVLLFARLGRLNLSFVPSHPDRVGGLGFLEKLPTAFAPVSLALSATIASRWAHQVVYHQQNVMELKLPAAMFVVVWSLLMIAPLVPLMPVLRTAKRAAMPNYAAMVAEQGRLVRRRWIEGTAKAEAPLMEPDGVGVIADAATMYNTVRSMRILPIGKASLGAILLPIVSPMLVVAALQVPIKTLLVGLLKTLI